MAKDSDLAICPSSKFVCDSLRLAEQLGVQHKNLLESLRRAAKAAKADCIELQYKPVEYTDDHGQSRPKFDLTFDDLITASMYIEKLKPRFREYIKTVTAQLEAKTAQLKAENQKLLAEKATTNTYRSPRRSNVMLADKKIQVQEEDADGESSLVSVLASSLSRGDLVRAIVAARDAQARGSIRQAELCHVWQDDFRRWERIGCTDEPCPNPLDYMKSCEYAGFFVEEDEDADEE